MVEPMIEQFEAAKARREAHRRRARMTMPVTVSTTTHLLHPSASLSFALKCPPWLPFRGMTGSEGPPTLAANDEFPRTAGNQR